MSHFFLFNKASESAGYFYLTVMRSKKMAKKLSKCLTKVEQFALERENIIRCCISKGNTKTGSMPSFSFPPFVTCRADAPCKPDCYANWHVYIINKAPHACYDDNWYTYQHEPEVIWKGIEAAMITSMNFRFFVSGDCPDYEFAKRMIEITKRQNHCQVICFTKKFELFNKYIEENGELPENLHLIYSAWKGMKMDNPYHLPECHLIYNDGSTTASDEKISLLCSGNCTECFCERKNCFNLKKDQQILIHQH